MPVSRRISKTRGDSPSRSTRGSVGKAGTDEKAVVVVASGSEAFFRGSEKQLGSAFATQAVGTWAGLVHAVAKFRPSVVVLDSGLRHVSAIERLRRSTSEGSSVALLLVVSTPTDREAISALRRGARGYCGRDVAASRLKEAVGALARGEFWFSRSAANYLFHQVVGTDAPDDARRTRSVLGKLNPRDREIARMVGKGVSNRQIAHALRISLPTVKAALTSIFRQFGVTDRVNLALLVAKAELAAKGSGG
jgi:DNA-binding NarL/FixJ family response regulator